MSKQDRTYTRTAADLERKYNLGQLAQGVSENSSVNNSQNNSDQVSKVVQELSEFKANVNVKFQSVETSLKKTRSDLTSHADDTDVHITETEKNNLNTALKHSEISTGNPHNVTKTDVGLGNVDNTADASKPVSTAQQTAIDNALANANAYTDEKIAEVNVSGSGVGLKYEEEEESLSLVGASIVPDGSGDNTNELQSEIDLVSALANANKAAHEANASAINTIRTEVDGLSGRITTIEDWKGEITEATSSDINGLFEIGE